MSQEKNYSFFITIILFIITVTSTITLHSKESNPTITVTTGTNTSFTLLGETEELAHTYYSWLNTSLFFNTRFIQESQEVRAWHLKYLHAQLFEVTTEDGITLSGTYFDRKSDQLIIVGSGFTNNREVMSPFVSLFDNYDVILFDFRGHGYHESSYIHPSTWNFSLSKLCFGADARTATLGRKEDFDILAVINYIKEQKGETYYSSICGVGVCYSSFIFLKTALKYPGLFDKLILDGCWVSLHSILNKLKKDPRLICVPQEGGWNNTFPFKYQWIQETLMLLAQYLMGFTLDEISLLPLLETNTEALNDTSILFWQGNHDLLTPKEEFGPLWKSLSCKDKTVIFTNNPHVRNHWKQKELYKLINELFCELPHEAFIKLLQDPEQICTRLLTKVAAKLKKKHQ